MASIMRIPSQITDSHWEWAKHISVASTCNVESWQIGKWMLFMNMEEQDSDGLTELDRTWFSVLKLVEETVLPNAKCSTAVPQPAKNKGVIICYTSNYLDKIQVKKAAEAIHSVVKLKCPMYYKTDEATHAGMYNHLGHQNASIYRFCPDGQFYERIEGSKWILIDV